MDIKISNCQNIQCADIKLKEKCLNIKYAINGTGKSTIAKAIKYHLSDELNKLTPYTALLGGQIKPSFESSIPIQKVSIFDEEYLRQYTFQKDEILANSFEIFIKNAEYEKNMEQIEIILSHVKTTFSNNEELSNLIFQFQKFINDFGKASGGYSKSGGIGKGLALGNKIEHIPLGLQKYSKFIKSSNNIDWIRWQSGGAEFLEVDEVCPYCTKNLSLTEKDTVQKVSQEYNSNYLNKIKATIETFDVISEFLIEETKESLLTLSKSAMELTAAQINFLKEIKAQSETILNQLVEIKNLDFNTLKNENEIQKKIMALKIQLELTTHFKSEKSEIKIEQPINHSLSKLESELGKLTGKINIQKDRIKKTITEYSTEINHFLEKAGYSYEVTMLENPETKDYRMFLKSRDCDDKILSKNLSLSYGERNALALVLFMYQSLKEESDLIVLDDPISSFDSNKKYAILDMLFKGKSSFKDKTVLMLTHDFDILIDLVKVQSIKKKFSLKSVAYFLENQNGTLKEEEFCGNDILSFNEIVQQILNSTDVDEINKMIFLRRYLEIQGKKNNGWDLLSSIFHSRETPHKFENKNWRVMTEEEIISGTADINISIPNFNYDLAYQRRSNDSLMFDLYNSCLNRYLRLQLFRTITENKVDLGDDVFKKFINEIYHIENERLFQLDPIKYNVIPEYIITKCDEIIENLCNNKDME